MAEPETEEFARLMRELKERGGLSYGVLARRLHTSTSTLHRYCAGEAVPAEFAVVDRFARACGATREEALALHRAWLLADARRAAGRGPSGAAAEPGGRAGAGADAGGAAGSGSGGRDGGEGAAGAEAEPGAASGTGSAAAVSAGAVTGAVTGVGAGGGTEPGDGSGVDARAGAAEGSGVGARVDPGVGTEPGDGAGAGSADPGAGAGAGAGVDSGGGDGGPGAAGAGLGGAGYRRRVVGVGGVVAVAVAAVVLAAAGPWPRTPQAGPTAGSAAGSAAGAGDVAGVGSGDGAGATGRPGGPAGSAAPGGPTGSASASPPATTPPAPSRGTATAAPPPGPVVTPLRATVRSHVWAAGCDHAYLSDRAPESVPAPPVEADAPAWARAQRAVHAGSQTVEVTLHGTGDQAVVLQGLEVRVTGRRTPPAWNVYQMSPGCGGGLTPAGFAVNLDAPRPLARPLAGNDSGTRLPAPAFPLRVSAADPAVLRVTAAATGCDCDWYLELRWSGPGGSGTLRLDDDGVPWRTSAATGRPAYGFAGELGRWSR